MLTVVCTPYGAKLGWEQHYFLSKLKVKIQGVTDDITALTKLLDLLNGLDNWSDYVKESGVWKLGYDNTKDYTESTLYTDGNKDYSLILGDKISGYNTDIAYKKGYTDFEGYDNMYYFSISLSLTSQIPNQIWSIIKRLSIFKNERKDIDNLLLLKVNGMIQEEFYLRDFRELDIESAVCHYFIREIESNILLKKRVRIVTKGMKDTETNVFVSKGAFCISL